VFEMDYKVIKTNDDYEATLAVAEQLIARDPEVGTTEAERLELLSLLIEDYEKRNFAFRKPDPISAIRFRMEEQGLRQADLAPLLGSRSRVSEVLAGKRPLTVQMIRTLSTALGIPAETLVGTSQDEGSFQPVTTEEIDWGRFPAKEMERRGWFGSVKNARALPVEDCVKKFFSEVASEPAFALYRRTLHGDGLTVQNRYSILAWTARVLVRAKPETAEAPAFAPERVSIDMLRDLARLSYLDQGPRLAKEFLAKAGITLIIEPALPKTQLDGVALFTEKQRAVIGLSLRFDRLDAFWFTLLHECVHVWKHLSSAREAFVDRLEHTESDEYREKEANRQAREIFIPRAIWRRSRAFLSPTRDSIQELAAELRIHPAIIVGRIHYDTGNYRNFTDLLGTGTVRQMFPEAHST
jgi:HTH-type transcriptional regulator/antitoxin HigA